MTLLATLKSHLTTTVLPSGRTYELLDVPFVGTYKGTLLLLHGFPDSWAGWRHQILSWSKRGYRVLAPSALGYGGTDRPVDPAEFTWKKLADDLFELLKATKGLPEDEKILLVSHDWGAFTGWRFLQWHSDKVKAFCSISIPFFPPAPPGSPYMPIEKIAERIPALSYQVYFNEMTAGQDLETHRERFLDIIYQTPENLAKLGLGKPGGFKKAVHGTDPVEPCPFWDDEARLFYNEYFEKSGFEAALGFYKSYRPKYLEETNTPPPDLPAQVPKLIIHPTYDSTALPDMMDKSASLPGAELVKIEKAGHWVLQTHPEEVEKLVGDWLDRVVGEAKL